jgi:hypothetical protein
VASTFFHRLGSSYSERGCHCCTKLKLVI